MWKSIICLAILLTGLILWDQSILSTRTIERADSDQVRRLIPEEKHQSWTVAAIGLEREGTRMTVARASGAWRLLEPKYGTYAIESRVAEIFQTLVDGMGVVLDEGEDRVERYGLDPEHALRLSLHGPNMSKQEDRDVLYAIDIGKQVPGARGNYVRPVGSWEIWTIERDLLALLEPRSSGPPWPVLDPHIIPEARAVALGEIKLISITRQGAEPFEIRRVAAEPVSGPQPVEETLEDFARWKLVRADGTIEDCASIPTTAYNLFLMRAPYRRLLGPSDVDRIDGKNPYAQVWIHPTEGEAFDLIAGQPIPGRGVAIYNTDPAGRSLFEISTEVLDLIAPTPEQLLDESGNNPWHPYLTVDPLSMLQEFQR